MVGSIEATAQLVPMGGTPIAPGFPLAAEDGVSFTGFIPADPGTYTLEIVFTGVFGQRAERIFLGRWVSDAFTVARSDTVSPTFSRPIDTIGRPSDGGDEDGDGLGLLDELFWSADPASADSDGDGLVDGDDCDPADGALAFPIAGSGSIEDCDADGVLRPDIPYKAGGTDCDDRDPAIRPGAEDVCTDQIDQDCNPETCPIDDAVGPTITVLEPAPDETVGCHRRIRARITDESGISEQQTLFVDDQGVVEAIIPMRPDGADVFITNQLDLATSYWLEDGPQRFQIQAQDTKGNTSTVTRVMTLALEVPSVSVTPPAIGQLDLPLDVTVMASSSRGIASIALMRAPWPQSEDVVRSTEVEIGRATSSPATFRLDPAAIPEGRYAVYAVVTDTVGNQNKPATEFSATGGATDADFFCIFDSGSANVPVREVVVGTPQVEPGKEPATMRDHLDEAIQLAGQQDPNAQLVLVRGFGLEADGYIRLDQDPGEGKRWWYEFFNPTDRRHIEITWYSVDYDITNPEVVVTEDYPFDPEPIMNPQSLVDSDAAAAAYAAGGCPPLLGTGDDDIRYESDIPFTSNDIVRITQATTDWKATAIPPITEIFGCN